MTFQQFNVNNSLTSVDLSSPINISGNYYNGLSNNGIGSQLIVSGSSLLIDNVKVKEGDNILLYLQTNTNENGIYVCEDINQSINKIILSRREDFQCSEQIKSGQYLTVGGGQENFGSLFIMCEPLPNRFGIDPLNIKKTDSSETSFDIELDSFAPGIITALPVTISDTLPISDSSSNLTSVMGVIRLNGIAAANVISGLMGYITSTGGSYNNTTLIAGVTSILNFTPGNSEINGANIYGVISIFEGVNIPTDLSKVKGIASTNLTAQDIQSHFYASGTANYLLMIENSINNYFLTAGNGAGKAGDTTHCNAQSVIKINVSGASKFIPVFDTN